MSKEARFLFIAVYLLVGFGIVMTYSASGVYAGQIHKNPQYFLIRQVLYAAIGTFALFITASIPLSFWKNHARSMILLALAFLVMVFLPFVGHRAGGARRWIWLGAFNFQPAEFAKIAVCLYLSDYLSRKRREIKKGGPGVFVPPLLLVGAVCLLTLLQPDLGSSGFMFILVCLLFFLVGIRLRYVLSALLIFFPVFYFLVMRVPYRLNRVTAYLNPWQDPQGTGFQIIQSFVAFGLGGIKGVGLGQSTQKLFYLPSSYNDFIFSIIGEELGLVGILFIMLLYAVIFLCGIRMAGRADQDYQKLLILSLTLLIVLQALIHMLVTTGLIPTKGLPLPFVSYGGTSLVFNLMAAGLLLATDRSVRSRN